MNENALAPLPALLDSGALTLTGLQLDDPDMAFERYEAIGRFLGALGDAAKWAIGDWLLFGEKVYGERYAQAALATGRSEGTLQDYLRVALRVARRRRREDLSWWHHRVVAGLEPADQRNWLERAAANGWTTRDLGEQVSADSRGAPDPPTTLPAPPSVLTREEMRAASDVLDQSHLRDTKVAGKLRAAAGGGALVSEQSGRKPCPNCMGTGYL